MTAIEHALSALEARRAILDDPNTSACRVFNGSCDGIAGFVLERFGPVLIAQLHEARLMLSEDQAREVAACIAERLGCLAVYTKHFPRDRSASLARLEDAHQDPQPWIGEPVDDEIEIREHGLAFNIRPHDGYSVGFFLEQRANRRRVRELARGRRVLNTFAYTCGFSVAAAAGGATETVSVDVGRRFLEWGKRNFAANGIDLDAQRFICSDVFDYYKRAKRQERFFDMVILDPPTFARVKGRRKPFVLTEQLDTLVRGAIERLSPGGHLLFSTNCRELPQRVLLAAVRNAARPRQLSDIENPRLPPDFRGDPDYARALIVRVD